MRSVRAVLDDAVIVDVDDAACATGVVRNGNGDDNDEDNPKLPIFQINKKLVTKTSIECRILCSGSSWSRSSTDRMDSSACCSAVNFRSDTVDTVVTTF